MRTLADFEINLRKNTSYTGVGVHGFPGDDGRPRQDAAPQRARRHHAREGQRGARGSDEIAGDEGEVELTGSRGSRVGGAKTGWWHFFSVVVRRQVVSIHDVVGRVSVVGIMSGLVAVYSKLSG